MCEVDGEIGEVRSNSSTSLSHGASTQASSSVAPGADKQGSQRRFTAGAKQRYAPVTVSDELEQVPLSEPEAVRQGPSLRVAVQATKDSMVVVDGIVRGEVLVELPVGVELLLSVVVVRLDWVAR